MTWANLDSRIREGSLSALILAENIGGIEGIDYDLMYDDLRRQINDIADLQWMMVLMGNSMGADALTRPMTLCGRPLTRSRTESCRRTTPMWCGSWRTR